MYATACAIVLLAGCNRAEEPAAQASAEEALLAPVPAFAIPASSGPPMDEKCIAIGTEPFWNVAIVGGKAIYTTPEDQARPQLSFM